MVWVYVIAAVVIYLILDRLIRLPSVGKYGERFVFITGCDSGFGNELARRLDSLGFNVFAACYTEKGEDDLSKVSSTRLRTVPLDVTKTESIVKARETVEKQLPPNKGIWAVVNNAGVLGAPAPSEMLIKSDYEKCFDVGLYGVIDVCRIFLPLVRKSRGRFVNMSSAGGRIAFNVLPYCISKYGVEAFTDCLRREVLYQGVTAHLIEPGTFRTPIATVDNVFREYKKCFDRSSVEVQEYYGKEMLSAVKKLMEEYVASGSDKTYLVVDAYTHAITAMFPRYRYLVGWDAKYLLRMLWNLPECLSDFLLTIKAPLPEGEKKK